eukprot:446740-Pleurochrysis_carterae.AAC.1
MCGGADALVFRAPSASLQPCGLLDVSSVLLRCAVDLSTLTDCSTSRTRPLPAPARAAEHAAGDRSGVSSVFQGAAALGLDADTAHTDDSAKSGVRTRPGLCSSSLDEAMGELDEEEEEEAASALSSLHPFGPFDETPALGAEGAALRAELASCDGAGLLAAAICAHAMRGAVRAAVREDVRALLAAFGGVAVRGVGGDSEGDGGSESEAEEAAESAVLNRLSVEPNFDACAK